MINNKWLKNIEPLCLPRNISSTSSTICRFDGKSKPGGSGKLLKIFSGDID